MKKVLFGGILLMAVASFLAFKSNETLIETPVEDSSKIQWMTWDEAIKANKVKPKKLFIDVYTDWCGWCKRMDATTFSDEKVVKYINDNFYAVKFNAEQKEDILYKGHTLKYQPNGRRGFHGLAYSLLDGKLGYPSYVYLDEAENRISISPGYKPVEPFLKELAYFAENHYKSQSFEDYKKQSK